MVKLVGTVWPYDIVQSDGVKISVAALPLTQTRKEQCGDLNFYWDKPRRKASSSTFT